MTKRKGILKCLFKLGLLSGLLFGVLIFVFYVVLRPEVQSRKEIYSGVFLTVEEIDPQYGEGLVMIAEIHWDTPGVELYFRPFHPAATGRKNFTLLPMDWLAWENDLNISVNSTRYVPADKWSSYPLNKVDTLETIVWRGNISHIHDKSYAFGWDEEWNFHYEKTKPPSGEFLKKLTYGLSLQGINIENGVVNPHAINYAAEPDGRSFLGVDPEKKVLWFLVFDKINDLGMALASEKHGVQFGGKMDSGDAAHMVIGFGAEGVTPHTGIRGKRPLAGIMGVRAEPLD